MKRASRLLDAVVDYQNLRLAWLKAVRGKRHSAPAVFFSRQLTANLAAVGARLASGQPDWGHYRSFVVSDPKQRTISSADFDQRVMHHALMNVLEPLFERHLVDHSYACRKGRGTHAAVMQAFHNGKGHNLYLQLDVRKYFDSIDHLVLKTLLRRLVKDHQILLLLDSLIDSYGTCPGKGLPIGNLTSQFFANYYLSGFDHHILEQIRPRAYVRYMDDFVLWFDAVEDRTAALAAVQALALVDLKLTLKPAVVGTSSQGLAFLGFLIRRDGIYLLQKARKRMRRRAQAIQQDLREGTITEDIASERAVSVNAAVLLARCGAFRARLWREAASGSNRVLRGGSWNNNASNATVSNRNNNNPNNQNNNIGFRVVRPPQKSGGSPATGT
ncbi:MAG: reverse transcriptase/maturase family protein [Spirochaetales bacterium]